MAKEKVKVTILSKEIIKPSQPTPKSASSIPLSLLDQLAPPIYVNALFFYSNYSPEVPKKLKSSLSETLKHFYPLAGRVRETGDGKVCVECNDEGVEVVEARVTGATPETICRGQKVGLSKELLPIKRNTVDFKGNILPPLAVQISELDAGGFVLGVSICHLIADGASLSMFLHWWSRTAQGFVEEYSPALMPPPRFDSASAFPPVKMPQHRPGTRYTEDMHDFAVKCFSIDSKGMERLKQVSGSQPTRVEAASALLWRCIQRAQGNQNNPMPLSHSVNLRKRLASVLSPESFGNLWFPVETAAAETDTARIVQSIRKAVRGIDEQFLKTKAEKVWDAVEGKEGKKEDVMWVISSWCRMGWYECDFGFEEPAWVAGGVTGTWNVCILIDAKDGGGIDAWLSMATDEMEKIENDHELYQFVCAS